MCKTDNAKLSDKQNKNKKKAKDLDDVMVRMKDKLPSFDYRTKIQNLIRKPEILLQTFSEFLSISCSEVRENTLSVTVTDIVYDFFMKDEHTRLMPGRKDFVSIKMNIHKQRHLLLCNLKEAYTTLK